MKHLYKLSLMIAFWLGLGITPTWADWTMSTSAQFDQSDQQFFLELYLRSCEWDRVARGNVTQYVQIPGLDSYAVNRQWGRTLYVRGKLQPETSYQVTVDGKICGLSGVAKGIVRTPTYPPTVEFLSGGLYFSKLNPHLRFRHRQLDKVVWKIYRIDEQNRYLLTRTEDIRLSSLQTKGTTARTQKDINYLRYLESFPGTIQTVTTSLEKTKDWSYASLDLMPYYKKGDWLVIVSNTGANKLIQFTDIGLYLRKNQKGIWGQTVNLEKGTPEPAKILLKQTNGEALTSFFTDASGFFQFNWKQSNIAPEALNRVEARVGTDSIELLMKEGHISLNSFPISGIDQQQSPYQAYVYSNRGLYRLGDTVHLTVLIRDWEQNPPQTPMSVELALYGPKGKVKHTTLPQLVEQNGGEAWTWNVPVDGNTGEYRAEVLFNGKMIGQGNFNVEQIVPPTIEGELTFGESQTFWDTKTLERLPIVGQVKSRFLFGAPAAGKMWEYRCVLQSGTLKVKGFEEFVFEDFLKVFPENTFDQRQGLKLDPEGEGNWECPNNRSLTDAGAYTKLPGIGKLNVVANVFEEGGRSITIGESLPVYFQEVYPGIKPLFEGNLEYRQPASFQIVVVDPRTGQAVPGVEVKVELFEKDYWGWYYFHRGDDKVVDSELTRKLSKTETVISKTEPILYTVTPPYCCDWELRVTIVNQETSSRVAFRNGWWGEDSGLSTSLSQKITFTLDKPKYTVGETAHILITAPFDGELILLHEKEGKTFQQNTVKVVDRKAEYSFPVTQEHGPWFQLAGVLLRTPQGENIGYQAKRETPYRALGMIQVQADNPQEILNFAVSLPEEGRPESNFAVDIQALDAQGDPLEQETWLTVSVVDEGILSLIRFKTPDPYQGLHRRPQYNNQWFDTLGLVTPYTLHKGQSAFGAGENLLDALKNVKRIKPMVWWSEVVKTNPQGKLSLQVPINDYTGRVRVMVVGWQNRRTGASEHSLPVLSPMDLITSLPRVIGADDQSQAVAEVFNNTDTPQEVKTKIQLSGPLQLAGTPAEQSVMIEPKKSKVVHWNVAGISVPGVASVEFTAQNENGDRRLRTTDLAVRPLGVPQNITKTFLLQPGESLSQSLPADIQFAPHTGQWEITLSNSPVIKLGNHLKWLVSYPYGCAEQTTSRLMAMLLLKPTLGEEALTEYLGEAKAGKIDQYIRAGIKKLQEMQMADGGFAYWMRGGYQYPWINAYATHFLWEAKRRNYNVPDDMYRNALSKLVNQAQVGDFGTIAYSSYILALNGMINKAQLGDLVQVFFRPPSDFDPIQLALGKIFTQGAAITAGYELPEAFFGNVPTYDWNTPDQNWWRSHHFLSSRGGIAAQVYGSAVRGTTDAHTEALLLLDRLAERSYLSTHTVAWTLLAADALFSNLEGTSKMEVMTPEGVKQQVTTHPGDNRIYGNLNSQDSVSVKVTNVSESGNIFGSLVYRGYPLKAPTEGEEHQIEVMRNYVSEEGWLLKPPYSVPQGTRLFVIITARQTTELDQLSNVVVEDWLPAGLELENQRLLGDIQLPDLPETVGQVPSWETDYIDYRDDKIAVFGTLQNQFRTFVYPVRAVSQGTFQLMPLQAEAMYIPEITATYVENNTITVTPPVTQ